MTSPALRPLTMILALADDGTLGHEGKIPWDLPEDLKRFKALTMDHAVIMGRKTWESLPAKFRPLPGRTNIVLTSQSNARFEGAHDMHSLEAAILWARLLKPGKPPIIIGGAAVYREALPLATRILLTRVHCSPGGGTRFDLDRTGWREFARDTYTGAESNPRFSIVSLERASARVVVPAVFA